MANTQTAGRSPRHLGKLATTRRALRRSSLALIGLFGPPDALSALVRKSDGSIHRVERGDTLRSGQVLAIDETGVMMEKNGRTWRLAMPSG